MRSAHKDTTQRYKSLAGFAIYACRVRYIFDAICPLGREGIYIISQPTAHLQSKSGGYIAFERERKYIAFAIANISPNKIASVDTDAVLARRKEDRDCSCFLCPFLVGRYYIY